MVVGRREEPDMRIPKIVALAILAGGLGLAVGPAQAADWVLLGERVVNDKVDHDTIVVTGSEGTFDALQVRVGRRPVHFLDMKG